MLMAEFPALLVGGVVETSGGGTGAGGVVETGGATSGTVLCETTSEEGAGCAQSRVIAQITQKAVKSGLNGVILKQKRISSTT